MHMSPHFGLRVRTARRDQNTRFWRFGVLERAGVLVCILLVLVTGFVAVAHVHANDNGAADHSCSLCALAHTGVAVTSISQPLPVFVRSILAEGPAPAQHSLLLVSSPYIRPPPQA
jgi:hypothetical protein